MRREEKRENECRERKTPGKRWRFKGSHAKMI
jgi:hypothetical protein